jgi:type II secretory pathway component PulK
MRNSVRHRGSVIIVAMIVLFALAAMVLTLSRNARVDMALSANALAEREADSIARGGEQYVLSMLTTYRDSLDDLADSDFARVPIGDGYFWVIRPNYGDETLPSFGLVDETTKLNLNTTPIESLRLLPGMTDDLAGAIVDWRDEDDDISDNGAESGTYLGRVDGYRAKNDAFEAVEELALVDGMTPELLYGTPDAGNAVVTEYYQTNGLADFFTVHSRQPNSAADGTARVNINGQQRIQAQDLIREKIGGSRATEIINLLGTQPVEDVFDMASKTRMTYDELLLVADCLSTRPANQQLRGLLNVNTAPREALLTLSNLSQSDVDSLLARRSTEMLTNPESIAWVYDVLKEKSVGLGNRITGRGRQYTADIVAVSRGGRAFKRVRIVVDTVPTTPRIIYRRDLTDRGWPMDQATLDAVRAEAGGTR